ncbi:hypothetical protein B296_00045598, partial [Ensete ventricosum]
EWVFSCLFALIGRCFAHGTGERSSFDCFGFRVSDPGMGFRLETRFLECFAAERVKDATLLCKDGSLKLISLCFRYLCGLASLLLFLRPVSFSVSVFGYFASFLWV